MAYISTRTSTPSRASEAARRRWAGTSPEARRANTEAASAAAAERRRTANAVLNALTAAGLTVTVADEDTAEA